MIMKEFRQDNTEGYTDDQLKIFNYKWNEVIIKNTLEPDTDEYNFQLKCFQNNIAKKITPNSRKAERKNDELR